MNNTLKERIRMHIGGMGADKFERFMCDLLPRIYPGFDQLEPSFNLMGKATKGKCDAHAYHSDDDTYTPIICTTRQTDLVSKILDDINKLSATKFASKIRRVLLCANTPLKDEIEEYRKVCRSRGWELEPLSLESMTRHSLGHSDLLLEYFREVLPEATITKPELRRFDCGKNLKEAREDIGVSISMIIESLDFPSEREWRSIESGDLDITENFIISFSELSGISADWIKHGSNMKYMDDIIYDYQGEKIDSIISEGALSAYMLIEPKSMDIVLLVQFSERRWRVYRFGFSLDFWNWVGDEHHIPVIFRLLKSIDQKLNHPQGRVISGQLMDELKFGTKHPSELFKKMGQNKYWFEDLFDLYHKFIIAHDYDKQHGEWFARLQNKFREHIKDESIVGELTSMS